MRKRKEVRGIEKKRFYSYRIAGSDSYNSDSCGDATASINSGKGESKAGSM